MNLPGLTEMANAVPLIERMAVALEAMATVLGEISSKLDELLEGGAEDVVSPLADRRDPGRVRDRSARAG